MMLRRTLLRLGFAVPLIAASVHARSSEDPTLGDDGLYKQAWFVDTFLEMGPDLDEAAAQGHGLMVVFEQRSCPYCRELHRVNFRRPEMVAHLARNWTVVQLDIWGAREVTDFDGEALEERDLARKWGVVFTPTVVLMPAGNAGAASLAEAEAFRIPGYFKPFHFLASLDYVAGGQHREQDFQRFLQDRFERLAAQGIEPDVW